jgi:hypothetical protein
MGGVASLVVTVVVGFTFLLNNIITHTAPPSDMHVVVQNSPVGSFGATAAVVDYQKVLPIGYIGLPVLPAFGLILLWAALLLDGRLKDMYVEGLNNGVRIENEVGDFDGFFHRLRDMPQYEKFGINHTQAFKAVMWFAGAILSGLFIVSLDISLPVTADWIISFLHGII